MPSDTTIGDRERPIRATDVDIVVRAPHDEGEVRAAFDALGHIFLDDRADRVEQWRTSVRRQPSYRPELVRTAWSGSRCVGAAVIHPRLFRVHGVSVPSAYITGVGVLGELRGHGVGSALMQDVREYCLGQGMALILLIGAHLFYDPFGYVDVFDDARQYLAIDDIAALPEPDGWTARRAEPDDAAAVLALYNSEFGAYTGHTERSLAQQRVFLELAAEEFADIGETRTGAAARVAVGPDGTVAGYSTFAPGVHTWAGCEVATTEWAAAVCLLKAHAALPAATGTDGVPDDRIFWAVPSDSRTTQLLGDHLPVQTQVSRRPSAGWVGVTIDPQRLLNLLRPQWSAVIGEHSSGLHLVVDDATIDLDAVAGRGSTPQAIIPSAVFLPLVFAHRTLDWVRSQPGVRIDDAALPALTDITTGSRGWITPSDGG